jgi:hypothetical protein
MYDLQNQAILAQDVAEPSQHSDLSLVLIIVVLSWAVFLLAYSLFKKVR